MVMVILILLKFSILAQTQAAPCLRYQRVGIAIISKLVEEDARMLLRPSLVSNGALPLAPGMSHTLSRRRELVTFPGPLPQECISSEVGTV